MLLVACTAFLGAIAQELVYWYGLRHEFLKEGHPEIDARYWVIMTAWSVFVPVVVIILHYDDPQQISLKAAFFTGIALPAIVKQMGQSVIAGTKPTRRKRRVQDADLGAGMRMMKVADDDRITPYMKIYYSPWGAAIRNYLHVK